MRQPLAHFRFFRCGGSRFRLARWATVTALLAVSGCGQPSPKTPDTAARPTKLRVVVVNYPLAYFAERIAGELIEVEFPVPQDIDPAYWEPDGETIASMQSAGLILLNGADYAKWTLRATLPWSRTIVTTRDVADRYIEVPEAITHTHGPEGEHSHAAVAAETWLDPELATEQARVISKELQKLLPESKAALETNFARLAKDLQSLDEELRSAFASSPESRVAAQMAFSYLGRRYEFKLPITHWDPEIAPSDEEWKEFETLLAEDAATLMLWEAEPTAETRERLRELENVRLVVFRTGEHPPESGDYLDVMRDNVKALRQLASPPAAGP